MTNNCGQLLCIQIILCIFTTTFSIKCGNRCCLNYYQHNNGSCLECPAGTHGVNCNARCKGGYYGRLCKEPCNCLNYLCDVIYGCRNESIYTAAGRVSSSWKSILFIAIGSIGTILIIGVVYCMKSWFNKIKTRAAGNQRGSSEDTALGNNSIQWNMDNERNEESLLDTNRSPQKGKLRIPHRKGSGAYFNEEICKKEVAEKRENNADNPESEYENAWSAETFLSNETFDNISRDMRFEYAQTKIEQEPYSLIEFKRCYEKEDSDESNSTYYNIDYNSMKKGKNKDQKMK